MKKHTENTKPIVIVDENPRAAQIIRDLLVYHGYRNTTICSNAITASSEIIKHAQEAILVTSYDLPNANGVQLIEKLSELTPKIKGIITTYEAKRVKKHSNKFPVLEKSDASFFKKMREHIDSYLNESSQ